jgi:competence protein ComEC
MTGPTGRLSGIGRWNVADSGFVSPGEPGLTGRLLARLETVAAGTTRVGRARATTQSVTMRFAGVGACASGCLSSLFLGDLGNRPQALMMAANRIRHGGCREVAHHGSG